MAGAAAELLSTSQYMVIRMIPKPGRRVSTIVLSEFERGVCPI